MRTTKIFLIKRAKRWDQNLVDAMEKVFNFFYFILRWIFVLSWSGKSRCRAFHQHRHWKVYPWCTPVLGREMPMITRHLAFCQRCHRKWKRVRPRGFLGMGGECWWMYLTSEEMREDEEDAYNNDEIRMDLYLHNLKTEGSCKRQSNFVKNHLAQAIIDSTSRYPRINT